MRAQRAIEPLEGRLLLSSTLYVDDDFTGYAAGSSVTFDLGHSDQVSGVLVGTNAFSSIQEAINAAAGGDTIQVARGLYQPDSTLVVDKPLTLLGPQMGVDPRPSAGTMRTAGSSDEATLDGRGVLSDLLSIASANVEVEGLELHNVTGNLVTTSGSGLSGVRVRYNLIHDTSSAGSAGKGLRLNGAPGAVVEYNDIYNIQDDAGVQLGSGSSNGVVRYNEIHDLGQDETSNSAIYAYSLSTSPINITVLGNLVYNHRGDDAIKIGAKNGADATVAGGQVLYNVVHDVAQDGITINASDTMVRGNQIYASSSFNGAIYVEYGKSNIQILNNAVHDNGLRLQTNVSTPPQPAGIHVGFITATTVNAPTGIVVSGNHLFNNTLDGVTTNLFFTDDASNIPLDATGNWWGTVDTTAILAGTKTRSGSTASVDLGTPLPVDPDFVSISDVQGASGSVADGGTTGDHQLTLYGSVYCGGIITVSQNGAGVHGVIGYADVDATGHWSLDYSDVTLPDATYTFTAEAKAAPGDGIGPDADYHVIVKTPPVPQSPAMLNGIVFADLNDNGSREAGENGVAGVTLRLYVEQTPGSYSFVADAQTAADGTYQFTDLSPGAYKVVEAPSVGQNAEILSAYLDGYEQAGTAGGVAGDDEITSILLSSGTAASGYSFAEVPPASLSGFVFVDFNDDGMVDFGEFEIPGTTITLSGTDSRGNVGPITVQTDDNGLYVFIGLRPGTYSIKETQSNSSLFIDGRDSLGTLNDAVKTPLSGEAGNDVFSHVAIAAGDEGINNNFGERPDPGSGICRRTTATIGFWHNKNGQTLLASLNPEDPTRLGRWLATTFPNLYGNATTNFDGLSGRQIGSIYIDNFFKVKGQKLDAQVLATTLAVYVTNSTLAGSTAAGYGFSVSTYGLGIMSYNVGSNGAAFGVASNTRMTVMDLLLQANENATDGRLWDQDGNGWISATEQAYRNMANNVFEGINESGDIGDR
jgi:hypothetical protein